MGRKRSRKSRAPGRLIALVVIAAMLFAGWRWLEAHPEHNPMAPLEVDHPAGWATATKLVALRSDIPACRAVLERGEVAFAALEPQGEGACARPDRTRLSEFPLAPDTPAVTCPVALGLEMWRAKSVEPAAREILGSEIARIEHLGAYSCRRMYSDPDAAWSQHATANAIDIAAFVLEDGRRISVLEDWDGNDDRARFLRRVRADACGFYSTVLSPDYNAAHADHFHFDQGGRFSGACR